MRGNSVANYKTDVWLKFKILLAVVAILYINLYNTTLNLFHDCLQLVYFRTTGFWSFNTYGKLSTKV